MFPLFDIYERVFTPEECQGLIAWIGEPNQDGVVAKIDTMTDKRVDKNIRSTRVKFIERLPNEYENVIRDIILKTKQKNVWNFSTPTREPLQYGVYKEGDHYDWHHDQKEPGDDGTMRKLSFSLLLNEDYGGGEFEYRDGEKTHTFVLNTGDMAMFPSFVVHRVKPILHGERHSLVGWYRGSV